MYSEVQPIGRDTRLLNMSGISVPQLRINLTLPYGGSQEYAITANLLKAVGEVML